MLSQTIEYALRAMTFLASIDGDASFNSETIAECTKVPKGYLSKILRDLVVADLIVSQRGPNGGFTLSRSAAKISMLDVVNAVDPIPRIRKCPLGNPAHPPALPSPPPSGQRDRHDRAGVRPDQSGGGPGNIHEVRGTVQDPCHAHSARRQAVAVASSRRHTRGGAC